ncbi:unnamed protein product, partial [Symbiodinium natans]
EHLAACGLAAARRRVRLSGSLAVHLCDQPLRQGLGLAAGLAGSQRCDAAGAATHCCGLQCRHRRVRAGEAVASRRGAVRSPAVQPGAGECGVLRRGSQRLRKVRRLADGPTPSGGCRGGATRSSPQRHHLQCSCQRPGEGGGVGARRAPAPANGQEGPPVRRDHPQLRHGRLRQRGPMATLPSPAGGPCPPAPLPQRVPLRHGRPRVRDRRGLGIGPGSLRGPGGIAAAGHARRVQLNHHGLWAGREVGLRTFPVPWSPAPRGGLPGHLQRRHRGVEPRPAVAAGGVGAGWDGGGSPGP